MLCLNVISSLFFVYKFSLFIVSKTIYHNFNITWLTTLLRSPATHSHPLFECVRKITKTSALQLWQVYVGWSMNGTALAVVWCWILDPPLFAAKYLLHRVVVKLSHTLPMPTLSSLLLLSLIFSVCFVYLHFLRFLSHTRDIQSNSPIEYKCCECVCAYVKTTWNTMRTSDGRCVYS